MAKGLSSPMQQEALRRDILRRAERLPSPPVIVMKLMHLADDETIGARGLEPYFRSDQSLTARLLKLVNSSYFGLSNRVGTIPEAIELLGFDTLRSILLSAFFSRLLPKALLAYGYGQGGLWKHSLGVATLTRELAVAAGCAKALVEELYVAGLMHDIGKVVLGEAAQKPLMLVPDDGGLMLNVTSSEREELGFDHVQVGKMVGERWRLSPLIIEIIEKHHDLRLNKKEVGIVHLADQICVKLRLGYVTACNYPVRLVSGIFDLVGLSPDKVTSIIESNRKRIERATAMFAAIGGGE